MLRQLTVAQQIGKGEVSALHMRRRIHACHMRRRIHVAQQIGQDEVSALDPKLLRLVSLVHDLPVAQQIGKGEVCALDPKLLRLLNARKDNEAAVARLAGPCWVIALGYLPRPL